MQEDFPIELLPKILQNLNENMGLEATLCLLEMFGGIRIYIPKKIDQNHKLWKLGFNAVAFLMDMYGGTFLSVPKASRLQQWHRNREIVERRKKKSVRLIAEEFNLTERQVWQILQEEKRQCQQDL